MGLESYNFLLVSSRSQVSIIDNVVEYQDGIRVPFSKVKDILLSIDNLRFYTPKGLSKDCKPECYYFYSDGKCIIEFEINAGLVEKEGVEEISLRLAVTSTNESFEKAIKFCCFISRKLLMKTIDVRLREVINFTDELQLVRSKKAFEMKKEQFYNTYDLPFDLIKKPMHCGKAFFDELRKK